MKAIGYGLAVIVIAAAAAAGYSLPLEQHAPKATAQVADTRTEKVGTPAVPSEAVTATATVTVEADGVTATATATAVAIATATVAVATPENPTEDTIAVPWGTGTWRFKVHPWMGIDRSKPLTWIPAYAVPPKFSVWIKQGSVTAGTEEVSARLKMFSALSTDGVPRLLYLDASIDSQDCTTEGTGLLRLSTRGEQETENYPFDNSAQPVAGGHSTFQDTVAYMLCSYQTQMLEKMGLSRGTKIRGE